MTRKIRLMISPGLLAAIFCFMTKANAATNAVVPVAATFKWKATDRGELRYLTWLPKDYNKKDGRRWPLVLFLHGAGERGTNLMLVTKHGPPKLAQAGTNFPFILIAPQCPPDEVWRTDALDKLLEQAGKKYRVDTKRVYLTGLSMGGYGTWELGAEHPEKFAALVPVCGGGDFITVHLAAGEKLKALQSLPVRAFHGAKDPVVPLAESERMVAAFKQVGVRDVTLTVYPEALHDSWTQTYDEPELYNWLLKQSR